MSKRIRSTAGRASESQLAQLASSAQSQTKHRYESTSKRQLARNNVDREGQELSVELRKKHARETQYKGDRHHNMSKATTNSVLVDRNSQLKSRAICESMLRQPARNTVDRENWRLNQGRTEASENTVELRGASHNSYPLRKFIQVQFTSVAIMCSLSVRIKTRTLDHRSPASEPLERGVVGQREWLVDKHDQQLARHIHAFVIVPDSRFKDENERVKIVQQESAELNIVEQNRATNQTVSTATKQG